MVTTGLLRCTSLLLPLFLFLHPGCLLLTLLGWLLLSLFANCRSMLRRNRLAGAYPLRIFTTTLRRL